MVKKEENEVAQSTESIRELILIEAEKSHASDIHIEPMEDGMLIRLRIDGVLSIFKKFPLEEHENLISHFKILASMDITHHTTPQEGHFLWSPPKIVEDKRKIRTLNIRVSFFPTIYGETAVMRLLNREDLVMNLDDFEMEKNTIELIRSLIIKPFGMVLVSGPAGSGKTTMLYSILNELVNNNINIVTLEDPVEYYFPNIRQSQINPDRQYTFAMGIRSVLRQDPDVIMVGEIRDFETAENAIRASLTGRLVLSTLHANNTIGTISRLSDMKIEKDILAYALTGVINKRLVRKICEECKTQYVPPLFVLKALGLDSSETFYHGAGCEKCHNTGFKGRLGIFEVLEIDEDVRKLIIDGASPQELLSLARKNGLKTLREDGIEKVRAGLTTPEELVRASAY